MKFHTHVQNENGEVVSREEFPWVREDYIAAIADIENTITPRRMREYLLGDEAAAAFMKKAHDDIEMLREEMGSL